ncbi:MAG: hypothetical protein QOG99_1757, partial [Frankiales bacterium]|nr:hypothetical protein [Frankiales bacterium]
AHLSGAVRSVELAAIGRRVGEVELGLLDLVLGQGEIPVGPSPVAPGGPHDRPSAGELVEAVREWLAGVELTGTDAFLTRVAQRALRTVERELALGPALAQRHEERLAALGFASDAELAAAIRAGDARAEVAAAVRDLVIDKLRVADPAQLVAGDLEGKGPVVPDQPA